MARIGGEERFAFASVPRMSGLERAHSLGVSVDLGLRRTNSALPLEPGDATMRERAGEPVSRGERLARVENRRDLGNDRQAKAAPPNDRRGCS
jgi:hypothetical protein